jgi:ABC-type sugar transport system ATPase subunit
MGSYSLQVEGVSKSYGATRALVGVSATFAGGETHCLLGENGAGKSTLGKVIGGLVDADAGQVSLDGQALHLRSAREARRAGIALVHQELSLAPDLSVRANLWLGSERRLLGFIPARAERERAATVLETLGLRLDAERRTGDLSPAEQQLVEIGKALMASPRLVVFDEPTATLGAVEKRKLFDVVRDLRRQGVAVVLITHHIEDVMEVADRVSVMRNGALVDSFMLGRLSADEVLERLTGKKRSAPIRHSMPAGSKLVLAVEGLVDGCGEHVRLELRAGEIVGVYGVVGCGAEKLVRGAVDCTQETQALRYFLHGQRHRPSNIARALSAGVAYLPAGRARNGILPSRSICENVTVGRLGQFGRMGAISRRQERQGVAAALSAVQAKFRTIDDPITSLSGGNQQKVLMARVLAGARDLLVLEEPTAGVDIDSKDQIHRLIRDAADSGTAVLLLSSDLAEAIALCHVIHTMYAGHLVGSHVAPQASDEPDILFDVLGKRRAGSPVQEPASFSAASVSQ